VLDSDEVDRIDEATIYAVTDRFELSSAVSLILGPWAAWANNLALILSLQVGLCAYLVTFAETTRNLYCRPLTCQSDNFTEAADATNEMCGEHSEYFVFLAFMVAFLFATAPLCMLNIGDNSYVQVFGTALRWITITLVLVVSFFHLEMSATPSFSYSPTHWSKVPLMIGIANSSFGCHEALPSVLYPIRVKKSNTAMLLMTFASIFVLYIFLSTMALAAFEGPDLADVFLLNFQNDCELVQSSAVRLFLTSYPIIPATTNFVLFHVVCQRNLRVVFNLSDSRFSVSRLRLYGEKVGIMFLASLLPAVVAAMAIDVGVIFSVGGAFASIISSWLFPTLMTHRSRQMLRQVRVRNPHQSPFGSGFWIALILVTILLTISSNLVVQLGLI